MVSNKYRIPNAIDTFADWPLQPFLTFTFRTELELKKQINLLIPPYRQLSHFKKMGF